MTADEPHYSISRRLLLGAGIATAVAAMAGTAAPNSLPASWSTPSRQMRLLLRLMASVGEAAVPWFYTGRIYAVRSGAAPLHLYNFEGSELYWIKPLGPERWSMAVSTLTFYRDRVSGEYLNRFDNPLTGKSVDVTANVLRSRPGEGAIYQAQSFSVRGETQPVTLEIHRSGDVLWLTTSRSNAHSPQPSMEVNTLFGNASDVDDEDQPSARATFSSVSLSHWSKWLDMGDLEGHQLWHAGGRKLRSPEELPADYRQRAAALGSKHFENPEHDSKG